MIHKLSRARRIHRRLKYWKDSYVNVCFKDVQILQISVFKKTSDNFIDYLTIIRSSVI